MIEDVSHVGEGVRGGRCALPKGERLAHARDYQRGGKEPAFAHRALAVPHRTTVKGLSAGGIGDGDVRMARSLGCIP